MGAQTYCYRQHMSQLPAYATNYGNTNNSSPPLVYSDSAVQPPNNYSQPGQSNLSASYSPQPPHAGSYSPQTPHAGSYSGPPQGNQYPNAGNYSQPPHAGSYSPQQPHTGNYSQPPSVSQQYPGGFAPQSQNSPQQPGDYPQPTGYSQMPAGYSQAPPGSVHTQMNMGAPVSSVHSAPNLAHPQADNHSISASFFAQAPPVDPQKKDNPYIIHWNKTVGIGAGFSEKGSTASLKGFPTYEITLYYVNSIFHGKVQPWNTSYAQAIKIFGPGVTAKVARATIRKQHDWLYRNIGRTNETGTITNGNDLLGLLSNGRLANGFILFYTYVVVDGIWRFSQTGKSKMKDFMSKHAAHAACSREVTYSGEFHIQQSPHTGGYKLILDNNSGTYAPDKNDLPRLVQLFQANFPGLEVEALNYSDPTLKRYLELVADNNMHIP